MRSEPLPALSRLFLQWRPSLSRYFRKRRAAAWDADDLLQEVWLRLQRSEAHAPEITNPEAYLFTIAANLMREHALLHQRNSQRDTCLDDVLERLAVPCEADAQVHRAQRRQRLAELMARLPPKCRAAMTLRYRDELGYQEIAEQLQISSHMVKKYIIKGLAVCRQGMARYA
ncbi:MULTISPECIES: sigma-70 family RNA polymerase sigma factor [Xanthomonas]|uniref:RNA polymerase sigma factor n=1 Tax=Xanthomonas TaxID=338 RepID=UPI00186ABECB|nr:MULTISPECIES: sigma-70 family RNA polymerase sigma factor [Xanthomonas]MCW0375825.1 putative RNA polymerase sigma factor FecI [Xanthomonas sacchari]MCW0378577.1 putative RNA polymerase sigma factor FecI [Xanthomonas sacchari]MCW0437329.1 putative RNA polymerase sigma factor FecI [Xanthomonas sacchari]